MLAAVVVNYRTPDETSAAVRSLAAGRRVPDAILVVDNSGELSSGSAAPQVAAIAGHGARVIGMPANAGFTGGANAGIRAALADRADTVFLLNSDAAADPACLSHLETVLQRTGAGIAGAVVHTRTPGGGAAITAGIRYSRTTGRLREIRTPPDRPTAVDAVSGCAMLVARRTIERIGLLADEYFFSFEDVDFCLRARAAGIAVVLAPDAVSVHEGSRSIGRRSPERLYFAARNHLLLADRVGQGGAVARGVRSAAIVALNLAHALFTAEAPAGAGLRHVWRGVGDHARGRYGAPSAA